MLLNGVAVHYHKCDAFAVAAAGRSSLDATDALIDLVAIALAFVSIALQLHSDPLLASSAHSSQIHWSLCFENPLFCTDCMRSPLAIAEIFPRIYCAVAIETVADWHCC